jgi:hypothetical protein
VMGTVRREAKAPPPLPFPWTRAAPGIAAAVLTLVLATASSLSVPSSETAANAPRALERVVEITKTVSNSFATLDARWALIWTVVAALTVVPILAPLVLIDVLRRRT